MGRGLAQPWRVGYGRFGRIGAKRFSLGWSGPFGPTEPGRIDCGSKSNSLIERLSCPAAGSPSAWVVCGGTSRVEVGAVFVC